MLRTQHTATDVALSRTNFKLFCLQLLLVNTEGEPFYFGQAALKKLTPVVVKSLERSHAEALKKALPTLQKYVGRFVLADPDASRMITFREFDVSIVNQKLALTVPELLPGSVVYMKETPLAPFGENVFHVDGGSFYGNFITFESSSDGSMRLRWRNYTFNRQR